MTDSPAAAGIRNPDLLGIYVNDHLMAATGGVELVARMLHTHRGKPFEPHLEQLLGCRVVKDADPGTPLAWALVQAA